MKGVPGGVDAGAVIAEGEYFAYSVAVDHDGETKDVKLDAVPATALQPFLDRMKDCLGDAAAETRCQNEFYRDFPSKRVVVRGTISLPEDREIVQGGFKIDRWYRMSFTPLGDFEVWPATNLLTESTSLGIKPIKVVRGYLRRYLDSLFTLRGGTSSDFERGTPHSPQPNRDKPWDKLTASSRPIVSYRSQCADLLHVAWTPSTRNGARRYVGVINVGQGACAALYDHELKPVVYFDFGFPSVGNPPSAPWNVPYLGRVGALPTSTSLALPLVDIRQTRPCMCKRPLVVFSHGDYDHWYMAELMRTEFTGTQAVPAIAPGAVTNSSMNALWQDCQHKDAMPPGTCRSFYWGYLVVCTGTKRNDSGIAAYVRVKDDPTKTYGDSPFGLEVDPLVAPFTKDEEYVLLPGDAQFRFIPWLDDNNLKLVGLVASHHGAWLGAHVAYDKLPEPAVTTAPIVYSYGLMDAGAVEAFSTPWPGTFPPEATPSNTQTRCCRGNGGPGHPHPDAVIEYGNKKWVQRRNTARDLSSPLGCFYENWLMGPSEMHGLSTQLFRVCSHHCCPDNTGTRAELFALA